jgi:hypothetical protein
MTRKDFEALAGVIKAEFDHNRWMCRNGHITVAQKLERDLATTGVRKGMVEVFKASNPRFDEARFIAATLLEPLS